MTNFLGIICVAVLLLTIAHNAIPITADILSSAFLNRTLDLDFNLSRNQTGHYIAKWSLKKDVFEKTEKANIQTFNKISNHDGVYTFEYTEIFTVSPPKPKDYLLFPGIGYYKFHPEGSYYYDAFTTCKNEGGHLAIINSEGEANVIRLLYAKYPNAKEWAYLGFNDIQQEGKYVTIYGDPLETTGYLKWRVNQPDDNGQGNEDCGSVHREGGLNDLWCSENGPWPFICEYDISWE